jgi:phage-related protein
MPAMRWTAVPRVGAVAGRTRPGAVGCRCLVKCLSAEERREIGNDIKTVQFGWPLGMPVVDHVDGQSWEVRTRLATRLASVLFVLESYEMILLHGFIKKECTTPKPDLDLARQRLKTLRSAP